MKILLVEDHLESRKSLQRLIERRGHEVVGVGSVEEAKREIATYVEDVRGRLTDVAANVAGDIERFPMTEHRVLCRTCNFRELCDRVDEPAAAPDDAD